MTIDTNISADRIALTQQLHALIIDYWHDVDTNWGRNAPDYFTTDGVWVAGFTTFAGRDDMRDFYRSREERGGRVVFHSVENFRADFDGTHATAIANWVMVLWGGDGVPVLPTRPPVLIDHLTERWVRTADSWQIEHRASEVLFMGGETLTPRPDRNATGSDRPDGRAATTPRRGRTSDDHRDRRP